MVDFRTAVVVDRYPTTAAIERLNSILGFSPNSYSQDWDIELSDGTRLLEFVDLYESGCLGEDERFTLMTLIVASADDALNSHGLDAALWGRIHNLLVTDAEKHADTVHYWCCAAATCDDECFTLTPQMRDVWTTAFDS